MTRPEIPQKLKSLGCFVIAALIFAVGVHHNLRYGNRNITEQDINVTVDLGWKIFSGQIPFVDFFPYFSLTLGYIQAFVFSISDVSLQSVLWHGSIINGLMGVVGFWLLRWAGVPLVFNVIYCLATVVVFYPPAGTPLPGQHAYFFAVLGLTLQLTAGDGSRNRCVIFYALAVAAYIAAALSKPVPTAYFAPLIVLAWLSLPRHRLLTSFLAGVVATSLILGLMAAALIAHGGNLATVYYYMIGLPLGIGEQRAMLQPLYIFKAYDFRLASVIAGLALGALAVTLLCRRVLVKGPMAVAVDRSWIIAVSAFWLVLCMVHYEFISQSKPYDNMAPVFLFVGLAHAAVLRHGDVEIGQMRHLGWLVAGIIIFDTAWYQITAVALKGFPPHYRLEQEVTNILDDDPAFTGMRFYSLRSSSNSITAEQTNRKLREWKSVTAEMRRNDENSILIGYSLYFYALTGRPSPNPAPNARAEYAMPPVGSPEFAELMATLKNNIEKMSITHALISNQTLQERGEAGQKLVDEAACGKTVETYFTVVKFCEPTGDAALRLIQSFYNMRRNKG